MTPIVSPNLHNLIRQIKKHDFRGRLVALDPGETTGFAMFERYETETILTAAQQLNTWPMEKAVPEFKAVINSYRPDFVVYETYHVYKWRLQEHAFSEVPTIQLIGAIKLLCIERNIPYYKQTALTGKSFATDPKLEYWGFYLPGLVHARDAIRHGCQYLLFGQAEP